MITLPIKLPKLLPAREILEKENIFIMDEERASQQDIRPLNILILNLMPEKEKTETHILRLLRNSPLQVNIHFLKNSNLSIQNIQASTFGTVLYNFSMKSKKKNLTA